MASCVQKRPWRNPETAHQTLTVAYSCNRFGDVVPVMPQEGFWNAVSIQQPAPALVLPGPLDDDEDNDDFLPPFCLPRAPYISRTCHGPQYRSPSPDPRLPRPSTSAAPAPNTPQRATSNAAPAQRTDEMESTNAGAQPAPAALPAAATLPASGPMQPLAGLDEQTDGDFLQSAAPPAYTYPDTPHTPHANTLFQRNDTGEVKPETPNTEVAANILGNIHVPDGLNAPEDDPFLPTAGTAMGVEYDTLPSAMDQLPQHGGVGEGWQAGTRTLLESKNTQGFAKLMFPDGDYIVTTHDVEIGRNMEIAARYRKQQKEQRREQQREHRLAQVPPSRRELAQRELEMYQQEPSQPSLAGEDGQQGDASNSSNSLEGRPAKQSTHSQTGGALAFAQQFDDDEDDVWSARKKKKKSAGYSKSSTSTTSVVPASLHPPLLTAQYSQRELFNEDGEPFQRTLATLPIHTQQPEDINKISKRHLLFTFNFQEECWELCVLGTGAFFNDNYIMRGETVPLSHNDEIQISSVTITFKLPDSHRHSPGLSHGTFSQHGLKDIDDLSGGEEAIETSPARRLSNAMEDAPSSGDEQAGPKKAGHKLKLKSLKKAQKEKKTAKQKAQEEEKAALKINLKKQQGKPSEDVQSPEEEKKGGKGKKPAAAAKQPAEGTVVESIEAPPAPPVFTAEPGSALASVPIDELPQKRKGPGRPPKNGLVSKRDQALVRKKERDFEKAGLAAPPFNKLLEMVRAETKQKEMLAKMQSGALPPGTEMPPAVETDLAAAAVKQPSASVPAENGEQAGSVPAESMRRPSSPRPKRVARSPSPMKPENSYSEEELKKPSATYVHILDEILRDHPSGQADLQEIYDRIQKRYPYYKYRVTTQGWQSSVRHNLLSAPRFKETGRSGKGKLWTIDHEVPLEREKKKKPTPPPRPPMMNGSYMPYGQQPYGNAYGMAQNGQRAGNGGQGFQGNSYGQSGQNHPGQGMANRQGPSPTGQTQANAGAAQQQQQSDAFGGLVPEILNLRAAFLAPYTNQPNIQDRSEWIGACITSFSNRFHGAAEQTNVIAETPEERKACADLDALFNKYAAFSTKQEQNQQSNANLAPAGNQPAVPMQPTAPAQHAMSQPPPQAQHQPSVKNAVADGVAYQTANGAVSPKSAQASAAHPTAYQGAAQPSSGQQPSSHQGGYQQPGETRMQHPSAQPVQGGAQPQMQTNVHGPSHPAPNAVAGPHPQQGQSGFDQQPMPPTAALTGPGAGSAAGDGIVQPQPAPQAISQAMTTSSAAAPAVGPPFAQTGQQDPGLTSQPDGAKAADATAAEQPATSAESGGTKRAAEDEASSEAESKRTKTEQ